MTKRPSDCSDVVAAAQQKRSCSHAFITSELLQLNADTELFFCLLYRDLLTHLTRFVLHGVGYCSEPTALRHTLTVVMTKGCPNILSVTLSSRGLPTVLYAAGNPNCASRGAVLFHDAACAYFTDLSLHALDALPRDDMGGRGASMEWAFSTDAGLFVVVASGTTDARGQSLIKLVLLDAQTGALLDASAECVAVADVMATFAVSHCGTAFFIHGEDGTAGEFLIRCNLADLRKPPLRVCIDSASTRPAPCVARSHACPYGVVKWFAYRGSQQLHIIEPSASESSVFCARAFSTSDLAELDMACCIKDQRGRLYVPNVCESAAHVCVWARGGLVCRVEIPRCTRVTDMRMCEPDVLSLICMTRDRPGHSTYTFVRCTVP